jgi:hypothetical protein
LSLRHAEQQAHSGEKTDPDGRFSFEFHNPFS